MSQSVNREFKVEYGGKPVQRINRYYASNSGYYLIRVKEREYEPRKEAKITDCGVRIINTITNSSTDGKWVNYQYYINKANKIVSEFVNRQLSLFDD